MRWHSDWGIYLDSLFSMATKPPLKADYPTGAPDSAKRLEAAEAQAAAKRERLEEELDKLELELKQADGDTEREKEIDEKITRVVKSLLAQTKMWIELAKQVNSFYKTVDESKRDGEKILRADVEEFFSQFLLSIKLAIESYIISLSQDATRCESPQEFYQAHDGALRSCMSAAIQQAISDGKLPNWAKVE